jgi:1,4-dihydroxy-2-naphthoate octaprenyltransferase
MKNWIIAARLRTLPLSISGILVGSLYALANPTSSVYTPTAVFSWKVFWFAIFTTIGLQVLSNFANDYGDGVKGADNNRIGPTRTVQSGTISARSMKYAIVVTAFFTLMCAILLIYFAFKNNNFGYSIFYLALALLAIVAAIRYTVGKAAYGYRGLGDLFVFIFFGFVSTIGVYFLHAKQISYELMLPAAAIGMLCTGVLNLNNMRDKESDEQANKNTLVVKIGITAARKYHYFLIIGAMVLVLIFAGIYGGRGFQAPQYLFLLAYVPLIAHLVRVYKITNPRNFDPELKKLALATFLLAVLLSFGMVWLFQDVTVQTIHAIQNKM